MALNLLNLLILLFVLALLSKDEEKAIMLKISKTNDYDELNALFSALYDSIFPKLWSQLRFKFKSTIDDETLKDAFQDGWNKILLNRSNFKEEFNPFNWIFTIMKNMILDKYKQSKNYNKYFVEKIESSIVENEEERNYLENYANNQISPQEQLHWKNAYNAIIKAIDTLEDETERILVRMRILEDKGLDEISKEMDIALSTVNYKIKKGLDKIKPQLEYLRK